MNARDYWRKRAEANMDAVQEAAQRRLTRIGRAYQQAASDLTQQVERIIGRYAQRMGLSREEALAALQAPMDEDSRAYAYRMTRAEALRQAAQEQTEKLRAQVTAQMDAQWTYAAHEAYERAGKVLSGLGFASPATGGVMQALNTRWSGQSYAQSIWRNTQALAQTVEREVTAAFLSGKTNAAIEQSIQQRFGVSFRQAERLVRTETSYVANQAALARYRDAGFTAFRFLTARDSRMCPVCADHDGMVVALSDAQTGENLPPLHPNCRCTVAPVEEEAARDVPLRVDAPVSKTVPPVAEKGALPADPKAAGSNGVRFVGRIDREMYGCVSSNITTDGVVLTEERMQHILEQHPQKDYAEVLAAVAETIVKPDYILQDSHSDHQTDTAIVLKFFPAMNKGFRVILRLATPEDDKGASNSVITAFLISKKKWAKYLRNKVILYRKE